MSTAAKDGAVRDGYILIAVLWVLVGVTALGAAISMLGRHTVRSAQNRINLYQAVWQAEDCLERARVVITRILTDTESFQTVTKWDALDHVVRSAAAPILPKCNLDARPAGARVNINAADRRTLVALLLALRVNQAVADSMADALLDWRDEDDAPRPHGAERKFYESRQRLLPRNAPLADVRELRHVRGYELLSGIDSVLDVERGRIALNHAPLVVLASLPGFTTEAVSIIAARRSNGLALDHLATLAGELSPVSHDSLIANYGELTSLTTIEPDAWILQSRGHIGSPPVTAVMELTFAKAATRAAIIRRRTWME